LHPVTSRRRKPAIADTVRHINKVDFASFMIPHPL